MAYIEKLLKGEESSHIRPFLWMKGEDIETIREELEKIWECGIREICLESRPHPDFCGPEWWKALDFILPWAKERGMKVWLLDDDKFPTGHANGGFERQPEKKKWYLAERHMDICGPCREGSVLVQCFMGAEGRPLAILAVPKPDGETLAVSGEGIIDLTDNCENGFVYFDLPEGKYRLFVLFLTQKGGGREDYMNLIDEASVRVLIDEVYEKHYEHYSEYFGNTIAGFFSDEPELGNVKGYPFDNQIGQRDVRLPWSARLETLLRECWGENFSTNLPALWYESGDKTAAVRSQYMDAMTGLVRDCFSVQIGEWCAAHGVEYIGHIIEDDNAHTRMACSIGHYFREMEGQHMAGIDVVHHQIVPGFTEPVHQWIAGDRDGEFFHYGLAKLASSAAHIQENKKGRALCEIFGNYGWAEGNNFMKWLTNHMLVRGINEFTPHAFSMTYPDRDCPPHFYARGNNPGFTGFTWLMKYMNRACALLSQGKAFVDAAVLYHAESEWSGGAAMYFQKPGRRIMEKQLDYDVIPADYLTEDKACVKEQRLWVGEASYACLILPYSRRLDASVAEFAEKAAAEGLAVWVIDELPVEDTHGKKLPESFGASVQIVALEKVGETLDAYVKQTRPVRLGNGDKDLRSYVREEKEGLTLMLFNESITKTVKPELIWKPGIRCVTVYDPWLNEKRVYRAEDAVISLEPGESVFLYASELEEPVEERKELYREIRLDNGWEIAGKGEQEQEYTHLLILEGGRELPNMNGRGYYPSFTGTYRYMTEAWLTLEEGTECMLRIPEAADSVCVIVNGRALGHFAGFPQRIPLKSALQEGKNEIVLEVSTTLVWKRKDGASTHLQLPASGLTQTPVIEIYR